jgi:hypothetical protein
VRGDRAGDGIGQRRQGQQEGKGYGSDNAHDGIW